MTGRTAVQALHGKNLPLVFDHLSVALKQCNVKTMTNFSRLFICLGVVLLLSGCSTGYKKINGKWSYVAWDEGQGYQTYALGADDVTFEILGNGEYAKDKNKVYYQREQISGADPATFILLKGTQYAKDKDHVYFLQYQVINADPNSFKEIAFPYARDQKNIYCGTIPLNVTNTEEFKVLKSSSMYSISTKDSFIKEKGNEEYSYLSDIPINIIVISLDGKARTKTEYFEGCNKK